MPRSTRTPLRLTKDQQTFVNEHVKERIIDVAGPMPKLDDLLNLNPDIYGQYTRRPGISGRWTYDYIAPNGGRVIKIGLQYQFDKAKDEGMIGRYYVMVCALVFCAS